MSFLESGQYRLVRYSNDGCSIYQCLWCKNSIEVRDDPDTRYNFCPICSRSWFRRRLCREQNVPRWFYNLWGNPDQMDPDTLYGPVYTGSGETEVNALLWYQRPKVTAKWVIECRNRWQGDPWREWYTERSIDYKMGSWMDIRRYLNQYRSKQDIDDPFEEEYRARLIRV